MKEKEQIDRRNVFPAILLFILSYFNYILLFIVIIGGVVTMYNDSKNPIDIGSKGNNLACTIDVVGKTMDGYRVALHSKYPVTEARALEMGRRNIGWIYDSIDARITEINVSPENIDPYEIVDIVRSVGLPDSIDVWALVAIGSGKTQRYLRPNPNDTNTIAFETIVSNRHNPFGAVFLNRGNVLTYSSIDSIKPYNYMGCFFGQNVFLKQDEEFSHIRKSDIASDMYVEILKN